MSREAHFHRCWTEATVDRYFTTEAMAKDDEAFMEVHLPISQILVDADCKAFGELGGKPHTDEEGLLKLILKSTPGHENRIFSVVGETGCGKSELCQWLYYKAQDEVHVPILIRRSMTRLRDIIALINRHLNEPVPHEMKDITDLWPETVSYQLAAAMLMHLNNPTVLDRLGAHDTAALRTLITSSRFEERMEHNFIAYCDVVKQLDKARILDLLPDRDFRDMVVESGGLRDARGCYLQLEEAIKDCLEKTLQVEDFVDKLRRISESYKRSGRRPVLLIEDITTFTFLQNDLLDYLFDLASGNYDVVIGITTGFEKANEQQIYGAQQTIRDRTAGRFILTDERNETLFLRDNYVQLARLYLGAVKDDECPICEGEPILDQTFGEGLYPYNERFLDNVYNGLQQDGNRKQTPRLFLRALRHTLLAEDMRPFESIEILDIVKPPTAYFVQSAGHGDEVEKILRWYGLSYNTGVHLSEQIADTFNVSVPQNAQIVNGFFRFGLRPGVERGLSPPPDLIEPGSGGLSVTRVDPPEGLSDIANTIAIQGANFRDGCTVHLNDTILEAVWSPDSRLMATVPADLPVGTYTITVTNPDGSKARVSSAYTAKEPFAPTITRIQPTEGEVNEPNKIHIEGANFQDRSVAKLGDTALAVLYMGPDRLKATVPADLQPGTYDLAVTNPDGKSGTYPQAYTVKPEDLVGQLDEWLNRQGTFPNRDRFKDGVWKLLDFFQLSPFTLQHADSIAKGGTPLVYTRGDKNTRVYLHGSADSLQEGYLKLTIHPDPHWRHLYELTLAVGLGNYDVSDADKLDHPLLHDWLTERVSELQGQMRVGIGSGLKMPLEQFVVLTKFLLLNNAAGIWRFDPENLAQPITGKPFNLPMMGERPEHLLEWRGEVQSLFTSFFHLRDSIVNYPFLSQIMTGCDPLKALSELRGIDSTQVYDAFSIGPRGRFSLRDLSKIVSRYASDLFSLQQGGRLSNLPLLDKFKAITHLCTPPEDIDPDRLRNQLDMLRDLCSHAGVAWQHRWDLRLSPLDSDQCRLDFEAFVGRVTSLRNRIIETHSDANVFVYLSQQQEIQAVQSCQEYEVMDTIKNLTQSLTHSLVGRSGDSLADSPRYHEFQKSMKIYEVAAKQ